MAEKEKDTLVEIPKKTVSHPNIHAALSAFQGELKTMPKSGHVEFPDRSGKIVKFDYTPLSEVMSTIYPLLAKHGLAVRHEITEAGVEAILTHATYSDSREVGAEKYTPVNDAARSVDLESRMYTTVTKNELRSGVVKLKGSTDAMKDIGAAITYARRYTLTMLLGISSEDDKDAELLEASAKNAQSFAESKARQSIQNATTEAEVAKAVVVLKKDLELVSKGKPGALGLTKEKYEELLALANTKVESLKNPNDDAA